MSQADLHLCKFCHRSVEKPCMTKATSDTCGQSVSKTRAGGAGARTITFAAPSLVSFHTCLDQVKAQYLAILQTGRDPLKGITNRTCLCGHGINQHHYDQGLSSDCTKCSCTWFRPRRDALLNLEAERRFIAWQKASRKIRPWFEVLKVSHKGNDHRVRVVRKFRDLLKAETYAKRRTEKSEGAASFQAQTRQGVVPVERPKTLLGFDPSAVQSNPTIKEEIMAKAKAKKGKKVAVKANGSATPKVKKDKAYYLKCVSGALPKTSGDFIRGRILQGKMSAEDIATEVRKKFKGHSTKASDVYWNRGQLKAQNIAVPKMGGAEK